MPQKMCLKIISSIKMTMIPPTSIDPWQATVWYLSIEEDHPRKEGRRSFKTLAEFYALIANLPSPFGNILDLDLRLSADGR